MSEQAAVRAALEKAAVAIEAMRPNKPLDETTVALNVAARIVRETKPGASA